MQAIVIERLGGPEVLTLRDVPTPEPGPGEILVDVTVAGVNFMDTGARQWGRADAGVPFVPGVEAAGVVRGLGPGVTEFAVGDRVAWVYAYGTYAEQIVVPAAAAVPVPDAIDDETAASVMMQGLTAHHFVTEAYQVRPGDVALVHAAAGGLGRLITQLVRLHGGTVVGLVSREEKVPVAREAGADHVLVSTGDRFVEEVRALSGGEGVHVVYDGNGAPTFRASMRALRRHGTLLYYGAFIGEVPTIGMRELPASIKVCYPVFRDHIPTRAALLRHSAELFSLIADGRLKVHIGGRYPLAEAARAHRDIEARATTGKLLLLPSPTRAAS
ncbi:quinone oxidoreductase family protein [Actinoallomurus iriomotensis]|uniref:Oxidoreductase n=1 Tax=Actinoallomurus iriomotensis TaxID=478107 RepID=A0A9W6VXQ9_9ACTN|nr:quinone oxidoreductase [Actinoallomurus iriomotensis]GLY83514.1 oxidoreductase [Actinoallomurus iriomotensis]